jgi:hypothetical protein
VTCYTQPCKPCKVKYVLNYLPQGDESSLRGGWGICAPALPEVLTFGCHKSYSGTPMDSFEYIHTPIKLIPQEVIEENNLRTTHGV